MSPRWRRNDMSARAHFGHFHYNAQSLEHTHTHTHTRLTALFPGLPRWAGTRKVKPIWSLLKQEIVSGRGISWAICKSASHSKQTTTPAPHHSVFTGRVPFLPPNQQHQSTEVIKAPISKAMNIYWIDMTVNIAMVTQTGSAGQQVADAVALVSCWVSYEVMIVRDAWWWTWGVNKRYVQCTYYNRVMMMMTTMMMMIRCWWCEKSPEETGDLVNKLTTKHYTLGHLEDSNTAKFPDMVTTAISSDTEQRIRLAASCFLFVFDSNHSPKTRRDMGQTDG